MKPHIRSSDALLLDFDGTLVDIVAVPDRIQIPPELSDLLSRTAKALNGALCIVSGRSLIDLRRYVSHDIDVSAEHGAVLETQFQREILQSPWPKIWDSALEKLEDTYPGLVVERKYSSIALHYRLNPYIESQLLGFAKKLCRLAVTGYRCINASQTIEIVRVGVDKGSAIEEIMKHEPYCSRRPIFIGDSDFDIPGFKTVKKMHGVAVHVGSDFGGKPSSVRKWLEQSLDGLIQ